MRSAHRSPDLSEHICRAGLWDGAGGIYFRQVWEWHKNIAVMSSVSSSSIHNTASLWKHFFFFLIAQPRVRWVWLNVGFPKTICLYQRWWKMTRFQLEGRRSPGGTGQLLYPVSYRSAAECIWNRAYVCHVVQPETNYSRGPSGLADQNSNSSKTTPGAA